MTEQQETNPLMQVMNRAEEQSGEVFDPMEELGIEEDVLLEYTASVVSDLLAAKLGSDQTKIDLDDLGYLLIVGLSTGVHYARAQQDKEEA